MKRRGAETFAAARPSCTKMQGSAIRMTLFKSNGSVVTAGQCLSVLAGHTRYYNA